MLTINFRDLPLAEGDIVLDLGCGEGRHAINAYLHADVIVLGVDLSPTDLSTTQKQYLPFKQDNPNKSFYLQQADATCLPFANASIDKVICSEVLEHIENYHSVLNEITRVLKPKGMLAVSVPRWWPEKLCWWLSDAYHQNEGGHIRIFNARSLRREIELRHLNFTKRHWAHALHTPYWWLKCFFWKTQNDSRIIRLYHRLLVWDIMRQPWITRTIEKCLNPFFGKSVVMYFTKLTDVEP
jgi:SAM-dependent methyltransferase